MMRVEWNTLRVGDSVLVHSADDGGDLVNAAVAFVTASTAADGSNEIGLRIAIDDETSYLWPDMDQVHHDPPPADDGCAHCATAAARPA